MNKSGQYIQPLKTFIKITLSLLAFGGVLVFIGFTINAEVHPEPPLLMDIALISGAIFVVLGVVAKGLWRCPSCKQFIELQVWFPKFCSKCGKSLLEDVK